MTRLRAMTEPDPAEPFEAKLLAYLASHPQAADSLAGVVRWWVGDDSAPSVEQVRRALDRLVDDGMLRRERLADGTDWYAGNLALPPAQDQTLH